MPVFRPSRAVAPQLALPRVEITPMHGRLSPRLQSCLSVNPPSRCRCRANVPRRVILITDLPRGGAGSGAAGAGSGLVPCLILKGTMQDLYSRWNRFRIPMRGYEIEASAWCADFSEVPNPLERLLVVLSQAPGDRSEVPNPYQATMALDLVVYQRWNQEDAVGPYGT